MQSGVTALDERIAALVADGFAGVVRVDIDGETELRAATAGRPGAQDPDGR